MTTAIDERRAKEADASRDQQGSHMEPASQPDAQAMGAETAQYTKPHIDPQWFDAWKMHVDEHGEYGVPHKVPRGQWEQGGVNALKNLRRPDGGFAWQASTPERTMTDPQFECFIGTCQKKLHKRIQVVAHVRAFHHDEAEAHKAILIRIEQQVAKEDPRLQRLLASMELDETGDPAPETEFTQPEASAAVEAAPTTEAQNPGLPEPVTCEFEDCGKSSPDSHIDPAAWLIKHAQAAHKDE